MDLCAYLKVYTEALTRFTHVHCPDGLNNTLLSQGCFLENGSHCGNDGPKVHFKDRGEGKQTTQVPLTGQMVVNSVNNSDTKETYTTSEALVPQH